MSDVTIRSFELDPHARFAFVIMQFSPPFEHLFNEVIKPVAEECRIRAEKADDILGPGMIIADITRRLQEADIVIADTTPQNPNVFYELGYAHAIGKPTIVLAEKRRELPFDVSGFRTLFYENSIAGKSQIEAKTSQTSRGDHARTGFLTPAPICALDSRRGTRTLSSLCAECI